MKKIFGIRGSLIGDIIMSLPILEYLKQEYRDEYYMYFVIAQKCEQAKPLFFYHPLINDIKITDNYESLGINDLKLQSECDFCFDIFPTHPKEIDWYNYRNCVEETALMASINPEALQQKTPKLIKYWDNKNLYKNQKTIAIWPFAGYGTGLNRSPSLYWWSQVVSRLLKNNYKVIHCGTPNEPQLINDNCNYINITKYSFFDQIQYTLECSLVIGTDSGSMWVTAAYGQIPQINLLTNWLPRHKKNKFALAPIGNVTKNLYADNGCDNINIESLFNEINSI